MSDISSTDAPRVLLVDDEPNVLASLRRALRPEGYAIRTAESAALGLDLLEQEPADVVISDMRMPDMTGAEFLKEVRSRWPESTRILLTGFSDMSSTVAAVNEGGIHAYLNKPWDEVQFLRVVRDGVERKRLVDERNALLALTAQQNRELAFLNEGLEDAVRARTAELRQTANFLELGNRKLKEAFLATLAAFSNVVELRHPQLGGHGKRAAELARKVAKKMGLREQEVTDIAVAALLHDIGKVGWSDEMIGKPFNVAFTVQERQLAIAHPAVAEKMLSGLDNMRAPARIIRYHHERFNGQGYPDGLSGLDIPLGARILAVVDDYDELQLGTIASGRRSPIMAANMIKDGSGTRYDPSVVKAFLRIIGLGEAETEVGPGRKIGSLGIEPGMRLARDVSGEEESILLTAGHELDERLISQLRRYEEKVGHSLEIWVSPD